MEYLVKVPFEIGAQVYKPGDRVSADVLGPFVKDLTDQGAIVQVSARVVKDDE
jgi:hypothetical protein